MIGYGIVGIELIYIICSILFIIINIEASTNIISKSEIFKPSRAFLFKHSNYKIIKFLHELVDCPYCTSVWVSLFYITMLYLTKSTFLLPIVVFIMLVIAFHRLSNILHHIIDRIDKNSGYDVLMDKENDK